MPTPFRHFKDELQDFLDGRLDAALSSEVQHHLETCETCRREYAALYWTKQVAAQRCAAAPAPADLRASILHSLRTEAASSQHQPPKIVPLAPQGASRGSVRCSPSPPWRSRWPSSVPFGSSANRLSPRRSHRISATTNRRRSRCSSKRATCRNWRRWWGWPWRRRPYFPEWVSR